MVTISWWQVLFSCYLILGVVFWSELGINIIVVIVTPWDLFFCTSVSWWSFSGVWMTASLLMSIGFFSVFWPIKNNAVVWMVSAYDPFFNSLFYFLLFLKNFFFLGSDFLQGKGSYQLISHTWIIHFSFPSVTYTPIR